MSQGGSDAGRSIMVSPRDVCGCSHGPRLVEITEKPPSQEAPRHSAKQVSLAKAFWWSAAAIVAFLLVEAAVFRSGWYIRFLDPSSSTGAVELNLYWFRRSTPPKQPEVLVFGDSRIAEGFSSKLADDESRDAIQFWNSGIPGTNPRVWYYMLRDMDPRRDRFRAIVLALDGYSDQDLNYSREDALTDLNFVIGRLRLTDCWDFAASMRSTQLRTAAFAGCMLKGLTLRRDVRAFLANPPDRLTRARDWRDHGLRYITDYPGKPENLRGLSVDFERGIIHFPAGLTAGQTDTVRSTVTPYPAPDVGEYTRYRRLWLGRILDLYQNSRTRIVFLELPRAPLRLPDAKTPPRFLASVAGLRYVSVLPKDTFRDLECPDLFADGLHLNHDGREIFSRRLAREVSTLIGSR